MNIKIIKEELYPSMTEERGMVLATIRVPFEQWIKFKNHLAELERQEQKRKEVFAKIMGLGDD